MDVEPEKMDVEPEDMDVGPEKQKKRQRTIEGGVEVALSNVSSAHGGSVRINLGCVKNVSD